MVEGGTELNGLLERYDSFLDGLDFACEAAKRSQGDSQMRI
jgi:hypothetical protein